MGRADSPLRDRMVFLVGAQRSGTNWLQRMIATHPDVVTLPSETQLFTVGIDVLADRTQHGILSSTSTATVFMGRDDFLDAARAFCDSAFGGVAERLRPGAKRILERSPNHVERLALVGDVYPDSWIVHLVRDGRDVARSLVSQRWGPVTVADAAALWDRSVRAARAAAPGLHRYCEVRYEDLLADPGKGVSGLFTFLGLDATDGVVAAALHEGGVPANTDERSPAVGDGKWRSAWGSRELAEFDAVAGDLLQELGYPVGDAAPRRARLPDVRELAGRVRRGPAVAPAVTEGRPHLHMEVRQRRLDRLCAALSAGDAEAATVELAPTALVRVVATGQDDRARDDAGRRLLVQTISAENGPWGQQRRGDVHVGGVAMTVVLSNDSPEGPVDRVIVVSFDSDELISALTLYRFPL